MLTSYYYGQLKNLGTCHKVVDSNDTDVSLDKDPINHSCMDTKERFAGKETLYLVFFNHVYKQLCLNF